MWVAVTVLLGGSTFLATVTSQSRLADEITGGDGYCYVIAQKRGGGDGGPYRLVIVNPGRDPVVNVNLRIFDAMDDMGFVNAKLYRIGDVNPGITPLEEAPPVTLGLYQVDIRARNGGFTEMLKLKVGRNGRTIEQETEVRRLATNERLR